MAKKKVIEQNTTILCRSCAAYGGCKLEKKGTATKCRNFWEHIDFNKIIKHV